MTLYAFMALPPWFCDLTLLSRETEGRALLGLGVAGTILLVLALATRPAGWLTPTRPTVLAAIAWMLGVAAFLTWYSAVFVDFLTPWRLAGIAATAIVGVATYLFAPRWLLPAVWSVAFVSHLALVNPVSEGLPEMLESSTMNHLRAIVRADPQARWAVYDSLPGIELIKTTGAQVVNGARIIPDFRSSTGSTRRTGISTSTTSTATCTSPTRRIKPSQRCRFSRWCTAVSVCIRAGCGSFSRR